MKRVTTTLKIVEALQNDLLTMEELLKKTAETRNRVTAAVHVLKKYGVIDSEEALFFLTGHDNRTRIVEEREEEKPNTRSVKKRKKMQ